ncbi:MAG: hypothetical protein AAFR70_04935 [Pseudomonadota bacterium]
MSVLKSLAFDEICHRRIIRAGDVTQLRGLFLANAYITAEEIEALLTIDRTCRLQDESWSEFLSDAITDVLVRDLHPKGTITLENAQWLQRVLAPDENGIPTVALFRVLMRTMTAARSMPASLRVFALQTIEHAVRTGTGPLRVGSYAKSGTIAGTDAAYAAAIIGTVSAECPDLVTDVELQQLLMIDAAATAHDPSWTALLQSLLAATALSLSGYRLADRAVVLNNPVWLEDDPEPSAFVTALTGANDPAPEARGGPHGLIAKLERQRIEIMTGEAILPVQAEAFAATVSRLRPALQAAINPLIDARLALIPELSNLQTAA